MTRAFSRAKAGGLDVTADAVLGLALRHRVLCGKWMIHAKAAPARTWTKVRGATFDHRLGCTAKISNEAIAIGCFLVCVYCADFTDKAEVLRVRQALKRTLDDVDPKRKTSALYFKPDCFTYLNINAGNEYKIRPTIYTCGGKKDEACAVLLVNGEKCTRRALSGIVDVSISLDT